MRRGVTLGKRTSELSLRRGPWRSDWTKGVDYGKEQGEDIVGGGGLVRAVRGTHTAHCK